MKKIAILVLCVSVFVFNSCDDEILDPAFQLGETSCDVAVANTAQAATNLDGANVDNYTQLCLTYRNALQAQIAICGDEDGSLQAEFDDLGNCEDENQQSANVEGTWLLTAWISEMPYDLNNDGVESANLLDEMDCYTNETIVFDADGTAVAMSTSYAEFEAFLETGTTNQYDFNIDCIQEMNNSNATWSVLGNTVTVETDMGQTINWTLNGNQLSTLVPEGFYASNEDQTIEISEDITFVYTKQ